MTETKSEAFGKIVTISEGQLNIRTTPAFISIYAVVKTAEDYQELITALETAYQKHLELKG